MRAVAAAHTQNMAPPGEPRKPSSENNKKAMKDSKRLSPKNRKDANGKKNKGNQLAMDAANPLLTTPQLQFQQNIISEQAQRIQILIQDEATSKHQLENAQSSNVQVTSYYEDRVLERDGEIRELNQRNIQKTLEFEDTINALRKELQDQLSQAREDANTLELSLRRQIAELLEDNKQLLHFRKQQKNLEAQLCDKERKIEELKQEMDSNDLEWHQRLARVSNSMEEQYNTKLETTLKAFNAKARKDLSDVIVKHENTIVGLKNSCNEYRNLKDRWIEERNQLKWKIQKLQGDTSLDVEQSKETIVQLHKAKKQNTTLYNACKAYRTHVETLMRVLDMYTKNPDYDGDHTIRDLSATTKGLSAKVDRIDPDKEEELPAIEGPKSARYAPSAPQTGDPTFLTTGDDDGEFYKENSTKPNTADQATSKSSVKSTSRRSNGIDYKKLYEDEEKKVQLLERKNEELKKWGNQMLKLRSEAETFLLEAISETKEEHRRIKQEEIRQQKLKEDEERKKMEEEQQGDAAGGPNPSQFIPQKPPEKKNRDRRLLFTGDVPTKNMLHTIDGPLQNSAFLYIAPDGWNEKVAQLLEYDINLREWLPGPNQNNESHKRPKGKEKRKIIARDAPSPLEDSNPDTPQNVQPLQTERVDRDNRPQENLRPLQTERRYREELVKPKKKEEPLIRKLREDPPPFSSVDFKVPSDNRKNSARSKDTDILTLFKDDAPSRRLELNKHKELPLEETSWKQKEMILRLLFNKLNESSQETKQTRHYLKHAIDM